MNHFLQVNVPFEFSNIELFDHILHNIVVYEPIDSNENTFFNIVHRAGCKKQFY